MSIQKSRDEPSGLFISDRFFQPEKEHNPHHLLWFLADVFLLSCLMGGLMVLFFAGFSVPVSLWVFPGLLFLCIGTTALFHSSWCLRHRLATGITLLILYLFLLFLCQDAFFTGVRQFAALAGETLNRTYNGEQDLAAAAGGDEAGIFLMLASIPVMLWLGVSLFQKNSFLMAGLLLFPLLALLALCGAADHVTALFLMLLGIVLCRAFTGPKRQHRMWGGANRQLKKENQIRFQSVQKKSAAIMLSAFLLLSVPGFFLVRPLLSVSLKPARQVSLEIQGRFLTKMMKLLPQISAGEWNLNAEAIGGGVQDGAIDSREGYLLEEVEDLRLTLSTKPKETIFLKGHIGTVYENGAWENHYGTTFDGAAMNWNTEGSPRLYIQNLPFLRTAYALAQGESGDPDVASAMSVFSVEPAEILVERINANNTYTYLPYGTYLNDYYEVNLGDGAVAGQSEQEDRFYFFFREDMEKILSVWNALEDTGNVLDRVEESYRAFCETNHQTDCPGMDTLQKEVEDVIAKNRWSADQDFDEITSWIRQYLAKNYQYQLKPESVPEGRDALKYFLFETKSGNSVHFGSAAVVLYRMFGIPARYVVGYEIPESLFSVQPDGTYTAVVQGDNAQAWAEIYIPGIGWTPEDMTPGVIGTYEEVGPGGERIGVSGEESSETETEADTGTQEAAADSEDEDSLRSGFGGLYFKQYSVEEIITVLMYIGLGVLLVTGLICSGRFFCRTFGYDPFHRYSREQCLVFIFQSFYARMRRLGLPRNADSQSEAFLLFCEAELNRRCPEAVSLLRPSVEKLYRSCFGEKPVSKSDISVMRRILRASYRTASRPGR